MKEESDEDELVIKGRKGKRKRTYTGMRKTTRMAGKGNETVTEIKGN